LLLLALSVLFHWQAVPPQQWRELQPLWRLLGLEWRVQSLEAWQRPGWLAQLALVDCLQVSSS
jgi:hypothetical protein